MTASGDRDVRAGSAASATSPARKRLARLSNPRYAATRTWAAGRRIAYRAALPWHVRRPTDASRSAPVDVYAFSCERDVPEQAVSIRSFLSNVAVPARYLVVSDGSHTERSRRLLRRLDGCVEVVDWSELARPDLPAKIHAYAASDPYGKKTAVIMSLPVERTTVYADADVVFFPQAAAIAAMIAADPGAPRYLLDCEVAQDERFIRPDEQSQPLNSGFFILYRPLDWRRALERAVRAPNFPADPGAFTEQTLLHLAMRDAGAVPLDPARFVMSVSDEVWHGDAYAGGDGVVLRHYVRAVRPKLWFALPHAIPSDRRAGP